MSPPHHTHSVQPAIGCQLCTVQRVVLKIAVVLWRWFHIVALACPRSAVSQWRASVIVHSNRLSITSADNTGHSAAAQQYCHWTLRWRLKTHHFKQLHSIFSAAVTHLRFGAMPFMTRFCLTYLLSYISELVSIINQCDDWLPGLSGSTIKSASVCVIFIVSPDIVNQFKRKVLLYSISKWLKFRGCFWQCAFSVSGNTF